MPSMDSKYFYWGSTILIALLAALSGAMYFVAQMPAETFERLGYPDYFRVLLGVGKLMGAAALLLPLPRSLKEWAYAAFTIDFTSAFISHLAVGDPITTALMPLIALFILMASYTGYHKYYLTSVDSGAVSA
jgi:hypothetical protein